MFLDDVDLALLHTHAGENCHLWPCLMFMIIVQACNDQTLLANNVGKATAVHRDMT